MAKLTGSINLIDNMSKVLNRITGSSDKMTNSIERSQQQMNQRTNLAQNMDITRRRLELVSQQYEKQALKVEQLTKSYRQELRAVWQLRQAYDKFADKDDIKALITKKELDARVGTMDEYKEKLTKAQLQQLKLAESVQKASDALSHQDNAMKNTLQSSDKLTGKLSNLLKTYLSFKAIKGLLKNTIGEAGELTRRVGIMQAAFGDADIGKSYFNQMQLYAIETRHDIETLTDVTRNFMQVTKNTKHLKGLTDAANKLSLRTGNIGSAENLMQEAMRGNFSRLQRTLHLTDKQMEPLKHAIAKGSLDGIVKGFDDAMNTAGLTDAVVDAYQNSPIQKLDKIKDQFKLGMARAGEDALEQLSPLLDRLNEWFNSSSADQFFGAISSGVTMIIEGITWLTNTIVSNWDIISPILLAITTVYLIQMIGQIWTATSALIAHAGAWIVLNWPILLIVGAIALFIVVLIKAGVTAGQITGFIGGAFGFLFAAINNGIAKMANKFAILAEFFVNVWQHPIYSVKALFTNLAINALDMAIAMTSSFDNVATNLANAFIKGANIAVGAVNWIIRKLNEIPGVNINEAGKFKATSSITSSMVDKKADINKWLGDTPDNYWKAPRMEYKDFGDSISKGYEFGASIPDRFSSGLDSIQGVINNFAAQEDAWNQMHNGGLDNLNDVGKGIDGTGKDIKKSVDKSSEDLKWLRDLAEMEAINRFTTAEVKVELTNNNRIDSNMDLDGVIDYMTEGVKEGLDRVAEGVL